jgi:hypothetical protein
MNILDVVVGKPIRTSDERAEQIGPAQGIPIFGLDALSSAAYGPEAALSLLIPLGLLGVRYIIPVSAVVTKVAEDLKVIAHSSAPGARSSGFQWQRQTVSDNAEDFKQGAKTEGVSSSSSADRHSA